MDKNLTDARNMDGCSELSGYGESVQECCYSKKPEKKCRVWQNGRIDYMSCCLAEDGQNRYKKRETQVSMRVSPCFIAEHPAESVSIQNMFFGSTFRRIFSGVKHDY